MTRRVLSALLAAMLALCVSATSVLALDDYTLPYYDPAVALSYGVDRDPARCSQLDYTGRRWADCDPHWGRVYDNHTGLDYPMPLQSRVAAARGGRVIDLVQHFGTEQTGWDGNYVLLEHGDGRRTLYYHLAKDGVLVGKGQQVYPGQHIARSGCSGWCFGPHLHFELLVLANGRWTHRDPMFEQRWTTWPGRVPFLASYVRESNASVIKIQRYKSVQHWVEFRNDGGRTWNNALGVGRVLLGTWNPATRSSAFRASGWMNQWAVTNPDQATVAPGRVGRFTFNLYAAPPPGRYNEAFNLLANSLFWFDHRRISSFYLPIDVTNSSQTLL
jgi:hypothetical protein